MEDHLQVLLLVDQEVREEDRVDRAHSQVVYLEELEINLLQLPCKDIMVKADQHLKEIKVVEQELQEQVLEQVLQGLLIVLTEHQENMLAVVVQVQELQTK